MIGLDTTAIIDFANGNMSLKKVLDDLNEPMVVNQVSFLEVMFGIDLEDENYKMEEDFYDKFFQTISNLGLDMNSSKKASRVYWKLKKIGKTIGDFDCAIAGIYLNNGISKIITRNVKHFENINGLEVISY